LKQRLPERFIGLNGGLETLDQGAPYLETLDGLMYGRAAYHTPEILGGVDRHIYGAATEDVSPWDAVRAYMPYLEAQLSEGVKLAHMTRHMLGLFHGRPGARSWRRILTVEAIKSGAGLEVVEQALAAVSPANFDADAAE
jgi:tRNA-dihydrouridine synthase A